MKQTGCCLNLSDVRLPDFTSVQLIKWELPFGLNGVILTTAEFVDIRHLTVNDAITNLGLFNAIGQVAFELVCSACPVS